MTHREMKTRCSYLDRNLYKKNPDRTGIRKRDARHKENYKGYFNKRNRSTPLCPLGSDDRVRIEMGGEKAWQTTVTTNLYL